MGAGGNVLRRYQAQVEEALFLKKEISFQADPIKAGDGGVTSENHIGVICTLAQELEMRTSKRKEGRRERGCLNQKAICQQCSDLDLVTH